MSGDLFDDTPHAPPKRVTGKKSPAQQRQSPESPQSAFEFASSQALEPPGASGTGGLRVSEPVLPYPAKTQSSNYLRHDRADATQLMSILDSWVERAWLRELDRAFADFLLHEAPNASPLLLLAAALASHQLGRGHVCLDLAATLADPGFALSLPPEGDAFGDMPLLPGLFLDGLVLEGWLRALHHPMLVSDGGLTDSATPLVREGNRLYLRRYWQYEREVRGAIDLRMADSAELQAMLPIGVLRGMLDRLFPEPSTAAQTSRDSPTTLAKDASEGVAANWQKLACALSASRRFSIITGGPGTGKTTTVVKLLALLQSLALRRVDGAIDTRDLASMAALPGDSSGELATDIAANLSAHLPVPLPSCLRIRLAAPTGKAAARLNESIAKAVQDLPLDGLLADDANTPHAERLAALRAAIPTAVTTLHRLLGSRPDTRHFTHNARRPLPLDVLVIDEASMVDLEMMSAVLAALPPKAQLILLGDKDQLSSVEAGAVLGELCRHARDGRYTPDTRDWLKAATGETVADALCDPGGQPLDQAVAMLRQSYRFTAQSGIGQLAAAVNDGDIGLTRAVWKGRYADLSRLYLPSSDEAALRRLVLHGGADGFPGATHGTSDSRDPAQVTEQHGPVGYQHYLRILRDTQPLVAPLTEAVPSERAMGETAPSSAALHVVLSGNTMLGQEAVDAWARKVLEAHAQFQILCALRKGAFGVDGLNQRIEAILHAAGLIRAGALWYAGRPVLVTRNDYSLGLMNGDVGMTLAVPVLNGVAGIADTAALRSGTAAPAGTAAPGSVSNDGYARHLRVAFLSNDGSKTIRWVLPSRLQAVETVYAMTVHKSQGSEFAHAALVLPERLNPILTRELVYTGITRARHWFTLASAGSSDRVFEEAIQRQVLRASGLVVS